MIKEKHLNPVIDPLTGAEIDMPIGYPASFDKEISSKIVTGLYSFIPTEDKDLKWDNVAHTEPHVGLTHKEVNKRMKEARAYYKKVNKEIKGGSR